MTRSVGLLLLFPAVVFVVIVLALPVGYLISFSFLPAEGAADAANHTFFANYARLAGDPFYRGILLKTIWISALSTVIAAVIGYCLAHFLWRASSRWRGVLTILVLCPLLVSIVVNSYGWMVILGSKGIINRALLATGLIDEPLKLMHTNGAIVVGLVHLAIPFMVLSILTALDRIEQVLSEAAATLGANNLRVFWHVLLPLAVPGIGAGTTLVFCICMSAYVTPALLGGNGPNFITTLIYNQIVTLFDWPFGATLAALLLGVSLGIVTLYMSVLSRLGATGQIGRAAR